MDIGQIGAQAQAAQSNEDGPSLTGNSELGQDQFLQLLVAQMQNQDPINPMDGKEFASQLAEFNSVEQLIGVNDGLSELAESQDVMRAEMTNSMASSLTGKQVRALSNKATLQEGSDVDINFDLANEASEAEIVVRDSSGSEVRRETMNGVAAGENSWTWDGHSNDGNPVPEGEYEVEINAVNGDEDVEARMFIEGTADRVRFTGEGVRISVNGSEIPIGDIESVSEKNN